jgi:hypothetical protein
MTVVIGMTICIVAAEYLAALLWLVIAVRVITFVMPVEGLG